MQGKRRGICSQQYTFKVRAKVTVLCSARINHTKNCGFKKGRNRTTFPWHVSLASGHLGR